MKTIIAILLLAIVLFGPTNIISTSTLNNCYLKLLSTATIEYNFENISANTLILDISSFEYKLIDENYIVVTLGYPPLNLYGFAILNRNNTIFFYSIRGDQNHWHKIMSNISGNIIIRVEVHNGSLTYELMSRGIVIDTYKVNISFESLELRNLVLTVASPYDSKGSWLMFKELVLTADNNVIVDLLPDNNTLTKIKEEDLIYPNKNNIEIVCLKPTTITKTLTYSYTATVTASPITTTSIVEMTKTYTTIIYSTSTTSVTETVSSIIMENNTVTTTETITTTSTITSTKEIPIIPIELYLTILALIIAIIVLVALLMHRK